MKTLLFTIFFFTLLLLSPTPAQAEGIYTTEKLITVDIGKQMLYAWEGGQILYQTPVSTGMRYTPTVKGSYSIYKKLGVQDMRGYYPPYEPYFIKNVPNVMYYHNSYAIHGAYWHNKFGSRVTHGCINVPVEMSQRIFDWAQDGTRVEIF